MKNILALAASATVLALAAIPAHAFVTYAGADTYLGSFTAGQSEQFGRGPLADNTAIDDYWIFDFTPAGSTSFSINFNPEGTITDIVGALYAVTTNQACSVPGLCASTIGAKVADATVNGENTLLTFTGILAGRYAVFYSGMIDNPFNDTNYTGQINFRAAPVPEPGSLALLGLGLIGLGLARRRK